MLVTGSLEGGGAERMLAGLANYWARCGWLVTVATWSSPDVPDFYELDARVRREWLFVPVRGSIVGRAIDNFTRVRTLRRLLRNLRPHAVLSFIDVPNVLTILACTGLDLRVVVSERHNPDQTEAGRAFEGAYSLAFPWGLFRRLLYRRASLVTALNLDAAEWIHENCGVRARVIPNFVQALPTPALERENIVLGAGRLVSQKGFDLLIRAFARLSAEFPEWRLLIFGAGPDLDALLAERDSLGMNARIEVREPVPDIHTWMGRAALVVLPSRFEAFGNVMLESLSMGTALITTRCSGPASFVHDRVNGRLVPVGDLEALVAAMRELMRDGRLRTNYGREAMRVRVTHSEDAIISQWEDCLFPATPAQVHQ